MSNKKLKIIEGIDSKTKIYLIIIAILIIILCRYNLKYIIPGIIIYLTIIVYTLWITYKRKGEISSYIDELTLSVDSAAKNTLLNSPFSIIILETDGNVIWKSLKFNKEFANIGINKYIDDIAKEISKDIENNNVPIVDKKIQIDEKTYHVIGNYVKIKNKNKERKKQNKYMTILYFIDVTSEEELILKYTNSKTCIGIIMIDNFEEVIQRISTEERPQIIANIEKILYEWANSTGGIIIKTERDTFVYVFDQEFLNQMEEEKFIILDNIKEIGLDESLQITLSIAISNEGKSNYEKYKSALNAMDIVLGRGGDQAIIRKDEKYLFFGGRTQELEKRTKVKARTISHALEKLIQKAKNVIIMGHANGDIDSLGSSLGLFRFAKEFGDEIYIVNNTEGLILENFIEELESDENEYKNILIDKQQALSKITENTLLIITDTHKQNYVEVPELIEKTDNIVIIDHHRKGTDFIENSILTFHEAYASSASELVTELIEYSNKKIELKQIEAESLYAGIMVDTKNFTFKTGVRTFEAAAYLRKFGVDIISIKQWFQTDLEKYKIISEIVRNVEIINNNIGISIYEKKDKNANIICAKAADELLTISNITASFVIGKTNNDKVYLSGRSIGDINVQIILEKMRRWWAYDSCRCTI